MLSLVCNHSYYIGVTWLQCVPFGDIFSVFAILLFLICVPKYLLIRAKCEIAKLSFSRSVLSWCICGSLVTISKGSTHVQINVVYELFFLIYEHGSFLACLYPCFVSNSSTV